MHIFYVCIGIKQQKLFSLDAAKADMDHMLHAQRYDMYLSACKVWPGSDLILMLKNLKY